MIDFYPATQLPCHCKLRPAEARDVRSIQSLTRKLHSTAIPQPKWQEYLAWGLLSCLGLLFLQYPRLGFTVMISAAPLWLVLLVTVVVAQQEQKQQYDRYWVMEHGEHIIGCGRLDIHKQHSEIYDLFVLTEWRSYGIGQAIMQQLIAKAPRPIYLASLPRAVSFYRQLGFRSIATKELSILIAGRLSLNSPRYRRVGLQPMVLPSAVDTSR